MSDLPFDYDFLEKQRFRMELDNIETSVEELNISHQELKNSQKEIFTILEQLKQDIQELAQTQKEMNDIFSSLKKHNEELQLELKTDILLLKASLENYQNRLKYDSSYEMNTGILDYVE